VGRVSKNLILRKHRTRRSPAVCRDTDLAVKGKRKIFENSRKEKVKEILKMRIWFAQKYLEIAY